MSAPALHDGLPAREPHYHGILTKSFGSQIRGGESSCRLRVATTPVLNPGGALDVAVVLDWEDFLRFGGELPNRRRAMELAQDCGRELRTGVFYRNPQPPPTYGDQIAALQRRLQPVEPDAGGE